MGKIPSLTTSSSGLQNVPQNYAALLRKAKIQQLASREEDKARKSRLESLLVQKLCVSISYKFVS